MRGCLPPPIQTPRTHVALSAAVSFNSGQREQPPPSPSTPMPSAPSTPARGPPSSLLLEQLPPPHPTLSVCLVDDAPPRRSPSPPWECRRHPPSAARVVAPAVPSRHLQRAPSLSLARRLCRRPRLGPNSLTGVAGPHPQLAHSATIVALPTGRPSPARRRPSSLPPAPPAAPPSAPPARLHHRPGGARACVACSASSANVEHVWAAILAADDDFVPQRPPDDDGEPRETISISLQNRPSSRECTCVSCIVTIGHRVDTISLQEPPPTQRTLNLV